MPHIIDAAFSHDYLSDSLELDSTYFKLISYEKKFAINKMAVHLDKYFPFFFVL